jgi:hypothetical protein
MITVSNPTTTPKANPSTPPANNNRIGHQLFNFRRTGPKQGYPYAIPNTGKNDEDWQQ